MSELLKTLAAYVPPHIIRETLAAADPQPPTPPGPTGSRPPFCLPMSRASLP